MISISERIRVLDNFAIYFKESTEGITLSRFWGINDLERVALFKITQKKIDI